MELVIEERSGDRRTIVLRGQSMPRQEELASFAVSQRGRINYPPGSPNADATLTGAVWEPMTIAGEWDDKFFGEKDAPILRGFSKLGSRVNGTVVAAGDRARNCMEIVEAMTSMCRGQQRVRVDFGPKIMFGCLWKFDPQMKLAEHWVWTAEFRWTGDTEFGPPVKTPKRVTARALLQVLAELLEKVRAALALLGTPASIYRSRLVAPFNRLEEGVDACIEELKKMVTNSITPKSVLGDMRANLTRIKLAAAELAEACSRLGAFGGDALRGRDKPIVEYEIILIRKEALAMAAQMAERELELAKIDTPDVLDIAITGARESLRDLAQRYYGTPADWLILATYNNLPCNPPSGTEVVIPTKGA